MLELLKAPFGPYNESAVLSSKLSSSGGKVLALKSFMMESNGKPIGFDESEDYATAQPNVRFRGILEVQELSWLTRSGYDLIEEELRRRASTEYTTPPTLAGLYRPGVFGERFKVHVLVQCNKIPVVSFYNSPRAPEGLIVRSVVKRPDLPDLTREYQILDIDISTLEHSHNYLCRYQLLNLMKKIVEKEPRRIKDRTIHYFVDAYLRHFSFTEWHKYNRWIFDAVDDSDVGEDGHTELPRHPRHIHRSEVISIFASQAEWLYENQQSKQTALRLVDLDVWRRFCDAVVVDRKEAARKGIRWGSTKQNLDESDDSDCHGPVGSSDTERKVKPGRRKTKKTHRQPEATMQDDADHVDEILQVQNIYDSDFESFSPEDLDLFDDLGCPSLDPELLSIIPEEFYRPPSVSESTFSWQCCVQGCEYTIDLLNLTDGDVEGLSSDVIDRLRSKKWHSVSEDGVMTAFYFMVNRHWERHLVEWDIQLTDSTSAAPATLKWIHPKRHRPWPGPEPLRGVTAVTHEDAD